MTNFLQALPCRATIDRLYSEYLDGELFVDKKAEDDVSIMSASIDAKMQDGSLSCENIADYEEASRRAGFYAGYLAALSHLRELAETDEEQAF